MTALRSRSVFVLVVCAAFIHLSTTLATADHCLVSGAPAQAEFSLFQGPHRTHYYLWVRDAPDPIGADEGGPLTTYLIRETNNRPGAQFRDATYDNTCGIVAPDEIATHV